jgi:cell division protease FtsH
MVEMEDFEFAKDKVLMGSERRSMILSEDDKKVVATHEAGHAVVAFNLPNADPIHKVSIVPRGMALGITQQLPLDDRYNYSREYLEAEIAVMLGGRTAEELYKGSITTGAGNDFEKATEMAWKMVTAWGMSDKMGPLSYASERPQALPFWETTGRNQYSERTAQEIDEEVKKIVLKAQETAREILTQNKSRMEALIQALLDREVLDKEEFQTIMRGETLEDKPSPLASAAEPAQNSAEKPSPAASPTLSGPVGQT